MYSCNGIEKVAYGFILVYCINKVSNIFAKAYFRVPRTVDNILRAIVEIGREDSCYYAFFICAVKIIAAVAAVTGEESK